MNLILTRDNTIPPAPDHLYGMLEAGTLLLQTIERPWIPEHGGAPCGEVGKSCVPVGTYDLVLHNTILHPKTFALENPTLAVYADPHSIPHDLCGRSECLIHAGNFASQSEGCILVGHARGMLNGVPDVTESRDALAELLAVVPWIGGKHSLTIT